MLGLDILPVKVKTWILPGRLDYNYNQCKARVCPTPMCLGLPGLLSDFGLVWSSSICIELIGFLVYIGISLKMILYTYLPTQLTNSTTQMKLRNLIDTSSWITSVLPIILGLVLGGPAKRVACNNTCYSSYFLGGHIPFFLSQSYCCSLLAVWAVCIMLC